MTGQVAPGLAVGTRVLANGKAAGVIMAAGVTPTNDLPFSGPGVQESGSLPSTVTISVVAAEGSASFLRVKVVKD